MNTKTSSYTGYMLFAVFVVPLLIAIAMYVMRGDSADVSTAAHGALIHPAQPIQTLVLQTDNNGLFSLDDIKGKWTYLLYIEDSCNLECEAALFKIRQTRISTGRERNRVQLLLATRTEPGASLNPDIVARNPGVVVGLLEELSLANEVSEKEKLQSPRIYIIDPNGNLMMKYDDTATSKGMLKDIKKLLKLSNIG